MEQANQTSLTPEAINQPQEPAQPVTPAPMSDSPKHSLPKLVLLLLIILLLGVAYISYSFGKNYKTQILPSPQPLLTSPVASPITQIDPTEGWKSFKEFEIQFKYPADWKEVESEGGRYITDSKQQLDLRTTGSSKKTNQTIKEAVHNYLENSTSAGVQNLQYLLEKAMIINGMNAWFVHYKTDTSKAGGEAIIFIENRILTDRYSGLWTTNYSQEYQEIFDQILSTFKFVDTTTDTSNWKTYQDTEGIFLIKYPADWQINSFVVKKGEQYKEKNRFDISSQIGNVTVLDISNQSGWLIRIPIYPITSLSDLGGHGPISNLEIYKIFTVADRTALRPKVEEGVQPNLGPQEEPYPMFITFKRNPDEGIKFWPTPDSENNFVALFSIPNPKLTKSASFEYYSTSFTQANIDSKSPSINKSTLTIMDQILSTFKFIN